MILTVDNTKIDFEKLNSIEDFHKFLDNEVVPISVKQQRGFKKMKMSDSYEVFDELTGKELAIANLIYDISIEADRVYKKMYPSQMQSIWGMAKMAHLEKQITLPSVNTEEYAYYQKLTHLSFYSKYYLTILIQSRLGYGLHTMANGDGKVYAIKDLRELHKANI
jgi:hypothetical protein